ASRAVIGWLRSPAGSWRSARCDFPDPRKSPLATTVDPTTLADRAGGSFAGTGVGAIDCWAAPPPTSGVVGTAGAHAARINVTTATAAGGTRACVAGVTRARSAGGVPSAGHQAPCRTRRGAPGGGPGADR